MILHVTTHRKGELKMHYNTYALTGMSDAAKKILPDVLHAAGYAGRFKIDANGNYISINSNTTKVSKFLEEAENKAQGCAGHMVSIRKTSYGHIWVPKTDADNLKSAYEYAKNLVSAGKVAVDDDPELSVACPADGPINNPDAYRNEWDIDCMPDPSQKKDK